MSEPRDRPVPLLERFERFLDAVIPPPDEIAAIVRRGEALLAAGDATGALRMAEQALGAAPGYLRGLLLKADALAARGAPYDALAALDEASRDRALPPEAIARMVEFAAAVGDERRALDLEAHTRARVRGTDRDVARRLLLGARSLVARGMDASGLRLARSATLVDPTLGAAWLLLADDAMRRGDRPQSRRALERALPLLESTDAWANRLAGDLALAHDELAAAARHLRRAWIAGDDGAVAPLVFVLARRGDRAALERVVADAQGSVAGMARAVYELGEGERDARTVLEPVRGPDLPGALWSLALETTLRAAPDIAERWAREAPDRPGSAAVTALSTARARLAAGDASGARSVLEPALAEAGTAVAARELFRDACRTGWRARLDAMLEELAVLARNSRVLAPLESELRTRRRELDDPLRVGILGEFSAGKSTFLNALVGATVSPMGVLPTTAYVHWLRFGDPGARIVDARGGAVLATIDEAPRVVEKMREQDERVDYVEVTMPVPRLARVELIDTPGFNAGDADHEAAVRRAFDIADVAIWLFDARQAGKLSETGPLEEARAANLPVLGVLNKIDQVREADRPRLLTLLRESFKDLAPLAVTLSAREALAASTALASEVLPEAERAAARDKLVSSGMAAFLAYLDEHLVAQRAAWKRLRIARRVRELVTAADDLLTRDRAEQTARAERRNAMLATLTSLREQLPTVATQLRRDVHAVLREQLKGLEGSTRRGAEPRGDDAAALAIDAASEIAYRARARAFELLAARVRDLERLAVDAGVLTADSAGMITALVTQHLDHAASEGVRDAHASATGASLPPGDPFASLEQAILRVDARTTERDDTLRIALEVARDELDSFRAPGLPMLGI